MKIELWYDAVAQEIDILLNGIPVEKNDIYGFLYPVRNYPFQSWILPNGSWKGLEYQITDLARDETVEIVFHGRKSDYDDLCAGITDNDVITLKFAEWDVCNRYDELFSNLLSTLKANDSIMRKLMSSLKLRIDYTAKFDVTIPDSNWAYNISCEADLANAEEATDYSCCFVHDAFFTTYEKLQSLLSLTRSLKIPADAIYCCFNSEQRKSDYEYYAKSFKRMNFKFYLEKANYAKDAKEKYGFPSIVRLKIERCGQLSKTLCKAYSHVKEITQDEFNRLKKNIVSLNQQDKDRYQLIKQLRDNADRFKFGMELIYKYIDILLSISKDNKDEVFHYECIDKLDENIGLYLNAKSLGGVN